MEQEFLFLNNLADAYRNYDVSYIENWLDDNMHYTSMWVFQELKSKEEYLDYLSGKLQTMKERNTKMDFEIVKGGMHNHALLVKTNVPLKVLQLDSLPISTIKERLLCSTLQCQAFSKIPHFI